MRHLLVQWRFEEQNLDVRKFTPVVTDNIVELFDMLLDEIIDLAVESLVTISM
jgi:hypothetical protein